MKSCSDVLCSSLDHLYLAVYPNVGRLPASLLYFDCCVMLVDIVSLVHRLLSMYQLYCIMY